MDKNVLIIGAEGLGSAIGKILQERQVEVSFYDRNPSTGYHSVPLRSLVGRAHFVFLCVPSWEMRHVISEAVSYFHSSSVIVCCAKGIDPKDLRTMDQLLDHMLPPESQCVILGGPMIASELLQGLFTTGVLATLAPTGAFRDVQHLFQNTPLTLVYTDDVHGVALAGVLKNIYSLGMGMIDALALGTNAKACFFVRAVHEMTDILEVLDGARDTAYGLAGAGDLAVTGYSPFSHNRQAGYDFITLGSDVHMSEGGASLPLFVKLLEGRVVSSFPVLTLLLKTLVYKEDPKEAFQTFFAHSALFYES